MRTPSQRPGAGPELALQERQIRLWATGLPWSLRQAPSTENLIQRTIVALDVERQGRPDAAREQLISFLEAGLVRRVGCRLTSEERVIYEALLDRGLAAADSTPRRCLGLGCGVIYRPTGNSLCCPGCRDSPATMPKPRAHHLADGPAMVWVDPASRRLTYEARCEACNRGFTAHDPRARRCLACRNGAGRQRLLRGGGTPTKLYRFEGIQHLSGLAEFTVSFNRGYGEQVVLEAVDGVVETMDAEAATQLDAMPFLRRLPAAYRRRPR